ncbi:MAG TPA: NUDIX domain-containing protein [Candidatus Saccharimonadales bacterium]|nr:NUDIX domain-containing protein [Candidatus Saccharimonadales bacterium]
MHHIQQKILGKLLYAEWLNYARLRPAGIESNHFSYHLEQLMRAKLIVKHDKRYTLTAQGLQHVDRLSHQRMAGRLQPHIVTAINLVNEAGQTLLYKRGFQPYIGRSGFPLGKLHYEETTLAAAQRELAEKTGVTGVPLTHRGIVYLESKVEGVTISKVLYHLFDGTSGQTSQDPDPARGTSMWMDEATLADHELMPGFRAIKKLLAAHPGEFFFEELCENMVDRDVVPAPSYEAPRGT